MYSKRRISKKEANSVEWNSIQCSRFFSFQKSIYLFLDILRAIHT